MCCATRAPFPSTTACKSSPPPSAIGPAPPSGKTIRPSSASNAPEPASRALPVPETDRRSYCFFRCFDRFHRLRRVCRRTSLARLKRAKQVSRVPVVTALGVSVATLYFAQEVLIPLAVAVLLSFLLEPLVKGLERRRI